MMEISKYSDICNKFIEEHFLDEKPDLLYYRLFGKNANLYILRSAENNKLYIEDINGITYNETLIQQKFEDSVSFDSKYFYEQLRFNKIFTRLFIDANGADGLIYIGDEYLIINYNTNASNTKGIVIYSDKMNKLVPLLQYIKPKEVKKTFNYITSNNNKFTWNSFTIDRNADVDLKNYNDDLPYDKFLDFCNKSTTGIALMYGEPGCGKTSLIKKLITNSSRKFILIEAHMLAGISESSFLGFLMNNCKDCIFVIEDCEKLLVSRDESNNPLIGTLLNLSDGLLGDALKLKFICTFNTSLQNIDKALLRKGRLKVKYEFKKLAVNKAKEIAKDLHIDVNSDISLADLYNMDKVDFSEQKKKKIGF